MARELSGRFDRAGSCGFAGRRAQHGRKLRLRDRPRPQDLPTARATQRDDRRFHARCAISSVKDKAHPTAKRIGDVLWPRGKDGEPVPRPPEGVEHSYAPLAIVDVPAEGDATVEDAREFLVPLARTTVP